MKLMPFFSSVCCILVVALFCTTPTAALSPVELADEFVTKVWKHSGIPGLAVGVVQNGTTVFAKGYGVQVRRTRIGAVCSMIDVHLTHAFVAVVDSIPHMYLWRILVNELLVN